MLLGAAPEMLRELRSLERKRGSSGRDRVDHRPGSHDDQANAVAGLVSLLAAEREPGDVGITFDGFSGHAGDCGLCGGRGYLGTGSAEAPRVACFQCKAA